MDLIDDDEAIARLQFLTESAGIPTEAEIYACVQQIVDSETCEIVQNQRCFTSLAGSEKEVGLLIKKCG